MKTLTLTCSDQLHEQLERLVAEGWASSTDEIVAQALRRFLENNRPEVIRDQILADVEWGLRGAD